jgi:DNA-binding protein HU-beta
MSENVIGKSQFIKRVADTTGYTQKQVSEIFDGITNEVLNSIRSGFEIRWTGFLTIASKLRAARDGRNPKTGEKILIPEKRVPSLKAGKELKDAAESA